jgi:hypothetical protein
LIGKLSPKLSVSHWAIRASWPTAATALFVFHAPTFVVSPDATVSFAVAQAKTDKDKAA